MNVTVTGILLRILLYICSICTYLCVASGNKTNFLSVSSVQAIFLFHCYLLVVVQLPCATFLSNLVYIFLNCYFALLSLTSDDSTVIIIVAIIIVILVVAAVIAVAVIIGVCCFKRCVYCPHGFVLEMITMYPWKVLRCFWTIVQTCIYVQTHTYIRTCTCTHTNEYT